MRFYLYVLAQKKQAKQHREERTSGSPAFSTLRGSSLLRRSKGRRAPGDPSAQPAVPASSAFGPMETRARPASRGRARCASFRMGRQSEQTAAVGADGGRLTSRSLPPAKACVERRCLAPQGQGGAAGVRDRRCLPLRGKSASELARLILACCGRKQGFGAFCPSGKFTGASGNGGTGRCAFPRKGWRYTPSRERNAPFSR